MLIRKVVASFSLALLIAVSGAGPAPAQTISAEDIAALKALPPEQRKALMQRYAPDMIPDDAALVGDSEGASGVPEGDGPKLSAGPTAPVGKKLPVAASTVQPGDVVFIEISPRDPNDLGTAATQNFQDAVTSRNPFEVKPDGALHLPGVPAVRIAGLSVASAEHMLSVQPAMKAWTMKLTVLPVVGGVPRRVTAFGHEIFLHGTGKLGLTPSLPVPKDYVLGPDDQLQIELFGNKAQRYQRNVDRDGVLNVPEFGPISVMGRRFDEVRHELEIAAKTKLIGTEVHVTMGRLRSIQVFVLGDVEHPGAYNVSSLSTVLNVLMDAGGPTPVGSMRSIQLKRTNEPARGVDLYSVLLQGDRSRDYSLQAGDVIFVPPVGHTVEIEGEVKRPAIYEYPNTLTLSEVIRLAGGLSATAYSGEITVDRVKRDGSREALHVDLVKHQGDGLKINDGDRLQIGRVLDAVENTIELTGWVKRPRAVPFRAGMHVGELVPSVEALEHNPDLTYGLIARENATDHHLTFLPFVPSRLFDGIGTAADPELQLRDKVLFFSKDEPRTGLLDPLLRRLREEPRAGVAPPIVTVNGEVAFPGSYPLTEGMTVKDLVSVSGGIRAITNPTAELAHFGVINQETRSSSVESVRLDGDGGATSRLSPYDVLTVRPVERSDTARWMIQLDGAVRFPGTYVISEGEALVSVLKRAGGFASDANPEGLVLIREDARRNEQAQLDLMTERLSHELSLKTIATSNSDSVTDKATAQGQVVAAQGLLAELKSKRAIGRVALPSTGIAALQSGASYDISMLGGDRIVVPRRAGTVTVIGEVLSPGAFAIASGHEGQDFIRLAGGVTRDADEKRAYVVGPDGLAQPFSTLKGRKMREGDTVVVPTNLKKLPPLPMWAAITQILSNMVITAAAIKQL